MNKIKERVSYSSTLIGKLHSCDDCKKVSKMTDTVKTVLVVVAFIVIALAMVLQAIQPPKPLIAVKHSAVTK